MVDSGATRHIYATVLGKGKVLLELTSRKTMTLSNVLQMSFIIVNLIFIAFLGNGVKVSFEFNKIVMTKKNNMFVEKGYICQGVFVLNISKIINEYRFESFTYIIDFYDVWHARL